MNYQDYIKYDPEKKQYTDSYGYVIDGVSSKAIPNNEQDVAVLANGNVNIRNGVTVGSNLRNQATFGASTGATTLATSGTDTTVNLDLNLKTASGTESVVRITPSYSNCLALAGGGTAKVTTAYSSGTNANLTLETKGSSSKIILRTTPVNEILEFTQANGSSTFTSTSADIPTTPNGDIIFVPRGVGSVTVSGPLFSSYGYFCAKRTSSKVLGNAANYIDFDTVVTNTFGSSYWTSSNRFTNLSGKTIKVMAQAFAFPSTVPAGGNGEALFEVYNSSNTFIGRYGRILYNWVNNSSPYNGVSPCGVFMLAPNDYIKLNIYCNGVTWTLIGSAGAPGEFNNLIIAQIP